MRDGDDERDEAIRLIRLYRAGERESFGALLLEIAEDVSARLRNWLGIRDRAEREDLVARAVVALLDRLDDFEPRSVRGWMFRVAKHAYLEDRKRRGREQEIAQTLVRRLTEDPEEERLETLTFILAGLSEEERDLLRKRYFERQSIRAIAATLGVTRQTVTNRLERIRKLIRDRIAKLEGGGD